MMQAYLQNEYTKKKFKVIAVDPQKNTITLQGEYATIVEPLNKPLLKKLGYRMVQEETP